MEKNKRAFTLIELLVVVLIIGVLAAVALPQYQKAVKKSQGTEALSAVDIYGKALSSYYLEHGTYEGVAADTLHIQMPQLRYFEYRNSDGYSSVFQTGSTEKEGKETYLYLRPLRDPQRTLLVVWNEGKFVHKSCSGYDKDALTCASYYGCTPVQAGTVMMCKF